MRLNFLRSQPEIRNNTLKIERDPEGFLYLRPTVGRTDLRFDDFAAAQSHVREFMGATGHQVFSGDAPVYGLQPRTAQSVRELTERGARVSLTHFRARDVSSAQEIEDLIARQGGAIVPDAETITLFQVQDPDGHFWSPTDVAEYHRKRFGETIPVQQAGEDTWEFLDKISKRQKMFMNEKTFGMVAGEDAPIRIGMADARLRMDMPSIIERGRALGLTGNKLTEFVDQSVFEATDGVNEISLRRIGLIREAEQSKLQQMTSDMARIVDSGDDIEITRLQEAINKSEKNVKQLAEIQSKRSGHFYGQLSGGVVESLDDNADIARAARQLNEEGIFFKGGFWVNENLPDDIDIRTYASVDELSGKVQHGGKKELAATVRQANMTYLAEQGLDPVSGTISLTPKGLTETFIDAQHVATMPHLMNRRVLEEGVKTLSEEMSEAVRLMSIEDATERRIPAQFRLVLESQLESADPQVRETARNILDFVERHPLTDDPDLARRAIDTLEEASLKDKGRGFVHPKIRLEDTRRAEIAPHWMYEGETGISARRTVPRVEPGYMRYQDGSWILHEADVHSYVPAWGGSDFDDATLGTIRYNPAERRIQAPMRRQPQALGEWALVNIYEDDDFVAELMNKALRRDDDKAGLNRWTRIVEREQELASRRTAEVQNLEARLARAQDAGAENVARRIETMLERRDQLSTARAHERTREVMHEMLSEHLTSIDEMRDASGQLPHRRGYLRDSGAFVGADPVDIIEDGVKRAIRYEGEPDFLAYNIKQAPSMEDARKVARQTLDQLTPEQQQEAFSGLLRRFSHNVGPDGNLLGQWINARMFYDHWLALYSDDVTKHRLSRFLPQTIFNTEDIIDVATQGVRDPSIVPETILAKRTEMIEGTIRASAEALDEGLDLRIDPGLFQDKANQREAQAALARINDARAEAGKSLMRFASPESMDAYGADRTSLFMHLDDPRATWSAWIAGTEQLRGQATELRQDTGFAQKILDMDNLQQSRQANRDAERLLRSYKNADARLSVTAVMRNMGPISDPDQWDAIVSGTTGMTNQQYQRHLQDEFLSALVDTFDVAGDGRRVAGDRTYSAVARLMQQIEGSLYEDPKVVSRALQRTGMFSDVLDWASGAEVSTPVAATDVYRSLGSVTRGPDLSLALDQMLRELDITSEMLEFVTKGIDVAGEGMGIDLPEQVVRQLTETEGPAIVPKGGRVLGPTDPLTLIRGAGEGVGEATELGELALRFQQAEEGSAARQQISRTISEALSGFQDLMEDWSGAYPESGEPTMPERLRHYVRRSMERREGITSGDRWTSVPGAEKAARAEEAARRAADVAEATPMKRIQGANILSDLWNAGTGGRSLIFGAVAIGVMGAARAVSKRDTTINDMQGPAFMPGGNPYVDDPQAHGSQMYPESELAAPSPTPSRAQPGVTYRVRTRGGNYDSDFPNELANITGGNVTGTTHNTGNPLRTRDVRQEVLDQYR